MDWKTVGKQFIEAGVPLLGTILGGPLGGLAGKAAGSLIASKLGCEEKDLTPQLLSEIIQNPDNVLKLKELEIECEVELQRLAIQQLSIINQTMQVEAKSEHWPQWLWRPLWGIISAGAFLVVCVFVCILAYRVVSANDMTALGMIPVIIGAFATLFGIPGAILGITAWGRNKLKQAKVEVK